MTALRRPSFNRKHQFRAVTKLINGYDYGDILNTTDPQSQEKPFVKVTLLQYYWTRFMIGKADDEWSIEAAKINKARQRIICRQVITEQKQKSVAEQIDQAELVAKQQREGLSEKIAIADANAEIAAKSEALAKAEAELEQAVADLKTAELRLNNHEIRQAHVDIAEAHGLMVRPTDTVADIEKAIAEHEAFLEQMKQEEEAAKAEAEKKASEEAAKAEADPNDKPPVEKNGGTAIELDQMTKAQLVAFGETVGIAVDPKLKKDEMLALFDAADEEGDVDDDNSE